MDTTSDTILIVDDELQIRRLLEITLAANGYNTLVAANGRDAMVIAATHHPSVIILDLGLPDTDGQQVLIQLRDWYTGAIIILSVRDAENDIINALDHGANDYLTKPFRSGELLARIRSAVRLNTKLPDEPELTFGPLIIDLMNHQVSLNHEHIKLTTTEFSLLVLLAKNEGRVLTHHYILKMIWGYGYIGQTQYLRTYVAQIRKKIEEDPAHPRYLITEAGIGYRFCSVD